MYLEGTLAGLSLYGCHPVLHVYLYSQAFGFVGEAANHSHGILREREYTAVLLSDQSHTFLLKPLAGVPMIETAEEAFHQLVPSRIHLLEVCYVLKGVGQITSSASCDSHLGQHLLSPFVDVNHGHRQSLLHPDGGKESRGATAYDGYA